jgi:hypothetical protein
LPFLVGKKDKGKRLEEGASAAYSDRFLAASSFQVHSQSKHNHGLLNPSCCQHEKIEEEPVIPSEAEESDDDYGQIPRLRSE